jgi:hypothetical protein
MALESEWSRDVRPGGEVNDTTRALGAEVNRALQSVRVLRLSICFGAHLFGIAGRQFGMHAGCEEDEDQEYSEQIFGGTGPEKGPELWHGKLPLQNSSLTFSCVHILCRVDTEVNLLSEKLGIRCG